MKTTLTRSPSLVPARFETSTPIPLRERRPPYRLRLATSAEDVRAAQLLRFLVFNVELQEGLDDSYHACLDADRFDDTCDHLLVEWEETGEVVGTYRLQTGTQAARGYGYYSEQEFEFYPYESIRGSLVELGRACLRSDHRNYTALNLLWKGIAHYAQSRGARYLIGCSSLTSQDPAEAASAYHQLEGALADPAWRTCPTPAFACPRMEPTSAPVKIPKLLKAYLMLGAKICGPPALDRGFKTVDFLTLLDLAALPASLRARWWA